VVLAFTLTWYQHSRAQDLAEVLTGCLTYI
jgi:hypothetical protein